MLFGLANSSVSSDPQRTEAKTAGSRSQIVEPLFGGTWLQYISKYPVSCATEPYELGTMTAITWSNTVTSPACTARRAILPPQGALTASSVFMDSSTTNVSPVKCLSNPVCAAQAGLTLLDELANRRRHLPHVANYRRTDFMALARHDYRDIGRFLLLFFFFLLPVLQFYKGIILCEAKSI